MSDFATNCEFPCLCLGCRRLVTVNLLATSPICPVCESSVLIPYDDPLLHRPNAQHFAARWSMEAKLGRDLKLAARDNYCPACHHHRMRFEETVMFD